MTCRNRRSPFLCEKRLLVSTCPLVSQLCFRRAEAARQYRRLLHGRVQRDHLVQICGLRRSLRALRLQGCECRPVCRCRLVSRCCGGAVRSSGVLTLVRFEKGSWRRVLVGLKRRLA